MKNQDRSTKLLLILLVVGVWGLLLRPFVGASPVVAQNTAKLISKTTYFYPGLAKIDGETQIVLSGDRKNLLPDYYIGKVIDLANEKGYKIHSITYVGTGEYEVGRNVLMILEK